MKRPCLFLIALACAVVAACSTPQAAIGDAHAKAEVADATEMNVDSLKQRLDAGEDLFVLDVRRPQELEEEGMIARSVNIPIDDLEARMAEVPKDKPIAIYCHHGGRAARAAAMLRKSGYSAPIEYGGISAWKEKGYAVAYPQRVERAGE